MNSAHLSDDAVQTRQIGIYFAALWLAVGLGGSVAGIPIQFYLKETLQLSPPAFATFMAMASLPLYVGFLFGFLRDRWQPFGLGDRGYLLLAAPPAMLILIWMGAGRITYARLLTGVLLLTVMSQLLMTATQALTTAIGQRQFMTGRLGAISVLAQTAPGALSALLGGWMVHRIAPSGVFGITAALLGGVFALSFWKPRAVFGEPIRMDLDQERSWDAIRRLVGHRPLWPAALILVLWNFSPGFQTPLFYHFTDRLKISGDLFGVFVAVFGLCFVPTALLYGRLCRHTSLWRLLWWGTAFGIVQLLPILLCRTPVHVILFAVVAGLLGGFASAAYVDLLYRSCPKGLEGTGSMLAFSGAILAIRGGDLFGTWLYQRGGFNSAILLTTLVYLMIVPALFLVPRSLVATREEGGLPAPVPFEGEITPPGEAAEPPSIVRLSKEVEACSSP